MQNDHNTALCEKEVQSTGTHVAQGNKSVALQTANGLITNKNETQ